ncbi:MAG: SUMF1/EgtB/PvdO family nonheme iron enzyme [Deltaproteobacteria bacterium]|nr:SUMF1/EgtB/PvdO family nonheme iron enzyme [Deltaproteobacteria bacterium]
MRKRHLIIAIPIMAIIAMICFIPMQVSAAIRITIKSGESLPLYKDYYALVAGVSEYHRWPDLPNASKDAREVKSVLDGIGFNVKLLLNPTSRELKVALSDLVFQVGRERDRALLFYFSGHGETLTLADGTELGYIIPSDCPLKGRDPSGFDDKAISMKEIEELALKVSSKHLLMIFDSCFSGSLFNIVKAAPMDITEKSTRPVRQFITAGGAGEQVPDRSTFKIVFLDGIQGYADLNGDGYVTGSELGMHLQDKVVNYTRGGQHPQYGKINNPKLDKGDFIFRLASSGSIIEEPGRASLSVESNVVGARVLIDGREVGTTPLTDMEVSPGEHMIRVEKHSYDSYRKRIRLEAGRSMSMYVDLSPALPEKGRLFVETEPEDANVRITNIGQSFYQGIELESGRYRVEVTADSYEKKSMWVTLDAGEDKSLDIRLKRVTAAKKGKAFTNSIGMKFVLIPSGTFTMGSPSDEAGRESDERQHHVTISKDFYMQATEVNQGQWQAIMGSNPSYFKNCGNNCPVEKVSWNDCQEFIKRLNQKDGTDKYRLPTEAEWEYACRGGSTTAFTNGGITELKCGYDPNLAAIGWYCGNAGKKTHPVAQKDPNTWGLYDMHGNVWEWCQDWYGRDYPSGNVTDPKGPSSGKYRVLRGGCWSGFVRDCRSANRGGNYPGNRSLNVGFRVARDF